MNYIRYKNESVVDATAAGTATIYIYILYIYTKTILLYIATVVSRANLYYINLNWFNIIIHRTAGYNIIYYFIIIYKIEKRAVKSSYYNEKL